MLPYWTSKDGRHVLYNADCMDVLPTLAGVDAVVTDPPYNVDFVGKRTIHNRVAQGGYIEGDNAMGPAAVAECLKITKRGVVFPGLRMMYDYPKPYESGCVYCPSGAGLCRWGFTVFHPILYYGVGLPHSRQSPSGFQSFETSDPNGHPCPKPVGWMVWCIEKSTNVNEVVIDPFTGSGTTGVACIRTGRRFIGIEISREYCDIAVRRMERELSQPKLPGMEPERITQLSLLEAV